jgi:hypothetical protein
MNTAVTTMINNKILSKAGNGCRQLAIVVNRAVPVMVNATGSSNCSISGNMHKPKASMT